MKRCCWWGWFSFIVLGLLHGPSRTLSWSEYIGKVGVEMEVQRQNSFWNWGNQNVFTWKFGVYCKYTTEDKRGELSLWSSENKKKKRCWMGYGTLKSMSHGVSHYPFGLSVPCLKNEITWRKEVHVFVSMHRRERKFDLIKSHGLVAIWVHILMASRQERKTSFIHSFPYSENISQPLAALCPDPLET